MRALFRSLSANPIQLAVLAAVVISLISVLFQIYTVYQSAWHGGKSAAQAAVEMMRDPAQRALYELNVDLANNVVHSLVNNRAAMRAVISDDQGGQFAAAAKTALEPGSSLEPLAEMLFGDTPASSVTLLEPNGKKRLGELRIEPDTLLRFQHFWGELQQFALIEFLRVFVLAFTLAYLFQYFVARPFRLLGKAIHQADPGNPQQTLQLLRESRVTSEVGELGRTIENFLLSAQEQVLRHNRALVRVDELEALQQSLAESERRYRSLISALSEGVVLQMADGRIVTANQAAMEILGLTEDQIHGRTSFDPNWRAIHEDGSPFGGEDHPAMVTLRTGNPLRDVRMGVHRGDGSLVWISINTQPLFAEHGSRPEAVVASFSDVTSRLVAERAVIAEKEAALRYLNTAGVMMLLVGPDGHIRLANRRAEVILGMAAEDLLGCEFASLMANDSERGLYGVYRDQVFATEPGEPVLRDLQVRNARGEVRQVSWSSVLVPDLVSGQPLMLCSGEDHTDEMQLRSSLELRSELLEGLAAGMPFDQLAAWLTRAFEIYFPGLRCCLLARKLTPPVLGSHHARLTAFWNEWFASCEFGGFAWPSRDVMLPQENEQDAWQQLLRNHADTAVGNVWARVLSVGGQAPSACWMIHFDAIRPPSEADLANIDVFLHVAVLALERAEHEALILRTKDDALAASRAKSDFLANMSHEIRTPLNAVIGFSSLLQQSSLDNLQREYVASVQTSGEALLGLINDLLDYSKIEAGHLELESLELDLRTLLDEVLNLFAEKADARQLYLSVEIASEIPSILLGDPGRLRQILINLVGNAIKFTESGGIRIRVLLLEQTSFRLRLRYEVIDSGIGLDFDTRSRLFQPFTQADASTTRKFGGTGLGLSICRRLVEAMDGQIGVESTPDHGSTFWFEVAMAAPGTGWVASTLPDTVKNARLLAISDCPAVLDSLHNMLGDGITLLNEREAVQADHLGDNVDVVLMDLRDADVRDALQQQLPPAARSLCWLSYAEQRGEQGIANAQHLQLLRPVRRRPLLDTLTDLIQGHVPNAERRQSGNVNVALAGAHPRILLAEDNPLNQRVARLMLTQMGCDVTVAENGEQALALVQSQPCDLVLMDCQMPVMDGFQATRAIRALQGDCARIPIIALTANAFQEDRDACMASGMDDFASKPVSFEALAQIVLRWFKPDVTTLHAADNASTDGGTDRANANQSPAVAALTSVAQALNDLETQLGHEVVQDVIALALGMTQELAPQLLPLLQSQDGDALARQAHKLKGTVAQIGADDAAKALKILELSARDGDWPACDQALQQAQTELQRLRDYLGSL